MKTDSGKSKNVREVRLHLMAVGGLVITADSFSNSSSTASSSSALSLWLLYIYIYIYIVLFLGQDEAYVIITVYIYSSGTTVKYISMMASVRDSSVIIENGADIFEKGSWRRRARVVLVVAEGDTDRIGFIPHPKARVLRKYSVPAAQSPSLSSTSSTVRSGGSGRRRRRRKKKGKGDNTVTSIHTLYWLGSVLLRRRIKGDPIYRRRLGRRAIRRGLGLFIYSTLRFKAFLSLCCT